MEVTTARGFLDSAPAVLLRNSNGHNNQTSNSVAVTPGRRISPRPAWNSPATKSMLGNQMFSSSFSSGGGAPVTSAVALPHRSLPQSSTVPTVRVSSALMARHQMRLAARGLRTVENSVDRLEIAMDEFQEDLRVAAAVHGALRDQCLSLAATLTAEGEFSTIPVVATE